MFSHFSRFLSFVWVPLVAVMLFTASISYAQKGGNKDKTIGVIIAPVETQNFSDYIEALGTTRANESVVITADTAEKISSMNFEDGAYVEKGDLLLTLDKSEEDAQLRAAEAELSDAKSSYERAKSLQRTNAMSTATLQERLSVLRRIEAEIEAIKARIIKRTIKAPFSGVLGLREVSVGALIQPGTPITTLDDLSVMKVDFDVPAVFLDSLKTGLGIEGHIDAFTDRVFKGEIRTINTQIDPITRTVTVRAVMPNKDLLLKPGLLMKIVLFNNPRKALIIQEEALIKRGQKNFVYIATEKDGNLIAKETEITLGSRQPGRIEVTSGLKNGDNVIVHGTVKIQDGTKINIRATETQGETLDTLLKQNTQNGAQEGKK